MKSGTIENLTHGALAFKIHAALGDKSFSERRNKQPVRLLIAFL
jgi:hypothetical protein